MTKKTKSDIDRIIAACRRYGDAMGSDAEALCNEVERLRRELDVRLDAAQVLLAKAEAEAIRVRCQQDRLLVALYRIVDSKPSLKETDGGFVVRLRAMAAEAVNHQLTYRCPACGSPSQAVADKVAECLSCGRFSVAAEAAGGEK